MALVHEFVHPVTGTRTLPVTAFPPSFVDSLDIKKSMAGGHIGASGTISEDEWLQYRVGNTFSNPEIWRLQTTWLIKDTDLPVGNQYIFGGTLKTVSPPVGGRVSISAHGWGFRDGVVDSWLWQSKDINWISIHAAPFVKSLGVPDKQQLKLLAEVYKGGDDGAPDAPDDMAFYVIPGQTFTKPPGATWDWRNGQVCWVEGELVTRIAFRIDKEKKDNGDPIHDSNYTIQLVYISDPPTGAVSAPIATWSMGPGTAHGTEVDFTLPTPRECVALLIHRSTEGKKPPARRFWLRNVRVNGRTDPPDADVYPASDAFNDVFEYFDADEIDVDPSLTYNVLPWHSTRLPVSQIADEVGVLSGPVYWRMVCSATGTRRGEAGRFGHHAKWAVEEGRFPVDPILQDQFNRIAYEYKRGENENGFKKLLATINPFPAGFYREFKLDPPEPAEESVMDVLAQEAIDYLVTERPAGKANAFTVRALDEFGDPTGPELPATIVEPGDIVKFMQLKRDDPSKYQYSLDGGETPIEAAISDIQIGGNATPEWTLATGHPLLDKWLARAKRRISKGQKPGKAYLGALDVDIPSTPTGVTLAFYEVDKRQGRPVFNAVADLTAVTTAVDGGATAIKNYVYELQPGTVSGGVFTPIGDETPEGKRLKFTIRDKDNDANDDLPTKHVFRDLPHPNKWYWRLRAYAVDHRDQESEPSAWTAHDKPAAFGPNPPPSGVMDVDMHAIHADWDAPDDSELDTNGDPQLDRSVDHYKIKHYKNTGTEGSPIWTFQKTYYRKGTAISIKVKKPGKLDHKLEIQSVDAYGNLSSALVLTGNRVDPPDPAAAPTITFDSNAADVTRGAPIRMILGAVYDDVYNEDEIRSLVFRVQTSRDNLFTDNDEYRYVTIPFIEGTDTYSVVAPWAIRTGRYVRAWFKAIDAGGHSSGYSAPTSQVVAQIAPPVPTGVRSKKGIDKVGIEYKADSDIDDSSQVSDRISHFQIQAIQAPEGEADPSAWATTRWAAIDALPVADQWTLVEDGGLLWKGDRRHGGLSKYFHSEEYEQYHFLRIRSVDSLGSKSDWRYGIKPGSGTATTTPPGDGIRPRAAREVATFTYSGTLAIDESKPRYYIDDSYEIRKVVASLDNLPDSGTVTVQVRVNIGGTAYDLFTTAMSWTSGGANQKVKKQADMINSSPSAPNKHWELSDGDFIKVKIEGAGVAAGDLVVQIFLRKRGD